MEINSNKKYWDLKPYWCQPWSIISFGLLVLFLSWKLFNNITISIIVGFFIIIWWTLFLILAPIFYQSTLDEQQS